MCPARLRRLTPLACRASLAPTDERQAAARRWQQRSLQAPASPLLFPKRVGAPGSGLLVERIAEAAHHAAHALQLLCLRVVASHEKRRIPPERPMGRSEVWPGRTGALAACTPRSGCVLWANSATQPLRALGAQCSPAQRSAAKHPLRTRPCARFRATRRWVPGPASRPAPRSSPS